MNLEVKYTQAQTAQRKSGATRYQVTLVATPEADEAEFFKTTRFVQTRSAIPVKIFHFAQSEVITPATGRKLETASGTIPVEAFARNGLPIQTWVNGAGLNIPYPGTISYGWVNATQVQAFKTWIDSELAEVAKRIADSVNRELATTQEATVAASSVTTEAVIATPKVVIRRGRLIA